MVQPFNFANKKVDNLSNDDILILRSFLRKDRKNEGVRRKD